MTTNFESMEGDGMGDNRDVSDRDEGKPAGKMQTSRRDFLKGMGISSAAAAVSSTLVTDLEAAETAPLVKGVREGVIQMEINGKRYRRAVKSHWTLLDVLRRELGLTGTKKTCDRSSCGACTVLMDGKPVYACAMLVLEANGHKITTIEGLSDGDKLHPIQETFIREDAYQCGFCTPGMVMSTKALLDSNPRASVEEIKEALSGNICRCAAYPKITKAVLSLVQKA